ncbi:MAG: hypothetical protein AAFX56_14855 [Pseudomonadota bacterium]
MNARKDSADWRQLREFRGVDLLASYIVGWQLDADRLEVDIDLQLSAEHPFYETPRPSEKGCIRAAVIEFPGCRSISRRGDDTPAAGIEALVAELGHGAVESFRVYDDGVYEIEGAFGRVVVDAGRPVLRLAGR